MTRKASKNLPYLPVLHMCKRKYTYEKLECGHNGNLIKEEKVSAHDLQPSSIHHCWSVWQVDCGLANCKLSESHFKKRHGLDACIQLCAQQYVIIQTHWQLISSSMFSHWAVLARLTPPEYKYELVEKSCEGCILWGGLRGLFSG
jgi:hypothetical protein